MGVEVIPVHWPQATVVGARRFYTVPDRLSTERRLAEITPLEAAHRFLEAYFAAVQPTTRYRPLLGLDPVPPP